MKLYVVELDGRCGGCNWDNRNLFVLADTEEQATILYEQGQGGLCTACLVGLLYETDAEITTSSVIYQADEWGYTVAVVEEGRIVHEYSATNNPLDSQGPVLAEGVSLETLQRWAEQTAREIAEEWGTEFIGPDEDMTLS